MLTLLYLNCTGFFSFGLMPTIVIDKRGVVFIRGINEDHNDSSNGVGKSSLLNSIKEILFGKNDTGKSGNNVVNNHKDWNNGMFGAIWLIDKNNIMWRIFVLRKWKGEPPSEINKNVGHLDFYNSEIIKNGNKYIGTDIFLERWDGKIWVDERPTSVGNKTFKDTQKKITENIVGMTYEQFSAYVFLGQNAESALVHGTSGGREKIIQTIADSSIWDKATHVTKMLCDSKENEANALSSKISGLHSAVDLFDSPSDEQINNACNEIRGAQDQIQQNNTLLSTLSLEIGQIKTSINNAQLHNKDVQQEIDLLKAEERHSLERYTDYQDKPRPTRLDELNQSINKLDILISQNAGRISKYENLKEGDCIVCGQKITAIHLATEIERMQSECVQLEFNIGELRSEFNEINNKYQEEITLEKKGAKDKYNYEISLITKRISDLQLTMVYVPELEHNLANLTNKEANATAHIGWLRNQIANMEANINSLHQRKKEHEQLKQLLTEHHNKHTTLVSEVQHLKWSSRNLQKLKLQEYEAVISRLNLLILDELSALWGPGLFAEFVLAKEKADGSGVKQELDLLIRTPNTNSVPIEMYSGGMSKIIIIAVFRAMRKLVNERGMGVNIAAIDEIDKDLDDYNADALVEAFSAIADDSSSCFVISHNSRILNTMRFDDVWLLRKKNEFTTIDVNN